MPATITGRLPKPDKPRILRAVYKAISEGHPIATAAARARIGETTFRDWLREGEAALSADNTKSPAELGSCALFAYTVKQAEANMVSGNLDVVNAAKHGDKGWLPAMTLLERRRPQDFGRTNRDTGPTVTVNVLNVQGALDPGTLRYLAERATTLAEQKLLPGGSTTTENDAQG